MTQRPAGPRGGATPDASRPGPESSDEEVVAAVVRRQPEALDLLYARYGRPAFGLARRILGDDGFAEDVVQEVFLTLWRDPGRYNPSRGGFASWLLSVTHHKAVDAVRREESLRRRRDQAAERMTDGLDAATQAGDVEEEVWTTMRRERVRGALKELPAPQREALALAYFGGYTQREVAALTGAPLGTVKTRMLTGMRRLAQSLGDATVPDGDLR